MPGQNALSFSDRQGRAELLPSDSHWQTGDSANDLSKTPESDKNAMTVQELERFIAETRIEPQWRRDADRCADYYDGNQLKFDVLSEMQERGIPPLIINLSRPIIDSILGMEAKTRSDWEVTSDEEASRQVAQALNVKMNEAQKKTYADRAISDAYANEIKAGLGWVEVGWNSTDPFGFRYKVEPVHRRELWWDFRDMSVGLEKARYVIRRRWFDEDVLTAMFPQFKDLVKYSVSRWNGSIDAAFMQRQVQEYARWMDVERAFTLDDFEWRDNFRRRCQLYEIWYRRWVRGFVFRLPDDTVVEVDQGNPRHMGLIAANVVQPIAAAFPKMRQSIWIGPHRIIDRKTPLPHNHFPYVPFWGYREDLTGAPYGVMRALMSPQDEINARRSKLLAMLNGRRVIADSDAISRTFNTWEDVADEVGRTDSLIVLDPNRKNLQSGFRVENNMDLAPAQMKTLEGSKNEMHETTGVFPPMQGNPQKGLSGYAINSLVDQSNTTMAEINDNYRSARRRVGELLLAHVKYDSLHPHQVELGKGKNRRVIVLNTPVYDEIAGEEIRENDVASAKVNVVLQDVPSTQTYRQQQFVQIAELTKSLPPEIQAQMVDFVVQASDVKDRDKVVARLRKLLNIPDPDQEDDGQPQDPMQAPVVQQAMQQAAMQLHDLTQRLAEAGKEKDELQKKVGNTQADSMAKAEAEKTRQIEAQNEYNLAVKKLENEREATDAANHAKLEELDLKREQLDADERVRVAEAQAAQAEPDTAHEEALAGTTEEVRSIAKAIADEFKAFEKTIAAELKTVKQDVDALAKEEKPDIEAVLLKALAGIEKRIDGITADMAKKPEAPTAKKFKIHRDTAGNMTDVTVS